MCPNQCPNPSGGFFLGIAILIVVVLIFYQSIVTLILPLRWNIFILLLEIALLIFLLIRFITF